MILSLGVFTAITGCDPPNPSTGLWSTIAKCLAQRGRTLKVGEFWREAGGSFGKKDAQWPTETLKTMMHLPLSSYIHNPPTVNCPTMHPNFRLMHQHTLQIWGHGDVTSPRRKSYQRSLSSGRVFVGVPSELKLPWVLQVWNHINMFFYENPDQT